jgi:hypothetical protein
MSTTQRRGGRRPLRPQVQRSAKVETAPRPDQRDRLERLADSRGLSTAGPLYQMIERELAAASEIQQSNGSTRAPRSCSPSQDRGPNLENVR